MIITISLVGLLDNILFYCISNDIVRHYSFYYGFFVLSISCILLEIIEGPRLSNTGIIYFAKHGPNVSTIYVLKSRDNITYFQD